MDLTFTAKKKVPETRKLEIAGSSTGNPNAKFLFVLEAANTSQVYTTVTKKDCPSLDMLDNGLLTVDSVMDGQKAIPLKLAL